MLTIKEGISLGKIWMKNSIRKGNDYTHCMNVEDHCLKIYRWMKSKKKISTQYSEEDIKLMVWWHDAYKSRSRGRLLTRYIEGIKSKEILVKELEGEVDGEILKAIQYHMYPPFILKIFGLYTPLVQILIEGDSIDALDLKRFERKFSKYPKYIVNVLRSITRILIHMRFVFVSKSEYLKLVLSSK